MFKKPDHVTKALKYYLKHVEISRNSHTIRKLVSCRDGVCNLDLPLDIINTLIKYLSTGELIELAQ